MAKLEIVNNKREIKKALKECIEKYPNYESIEVYTWLNDCSIVHERDENDKVTSVTDFDDYRVMIFFSSGWADENNKWINGNKMLVWKQGRSFERTFNPSEGFDASYREDKALQLEDYKVMRECKRATFELHEWCKQNFDRVNDVEDWLIFD